MVVSEVYAHAVDHALTAGFSISQLDMTIPAGGITMQVDSENRGTGEAYVEFVKPDDAEKALYKNRQMMGHRYIMYCVYGHSTFY